METKRTPESKGMGMRRDELPREVLRYVDNLKQQIKDILEKHNLTIADITNTPPLEETSSARPAFSDFLKDPKWNSLKKSPPDYKKLAELIKLLEKTVIEGRISEENHGPETWDWEEGERALFEGVSEFGSRFHALDEPAASPDREHFAVVIFHGSDGPAELFVDKNFWMIKAKKIENQVWSPDSKRLAAVIKDHSERYYVAVNDEKVWGKEFEKKISDLSWSPDGKHLAAIYGKTRILIDGELMPEEFDLITSIVWHPDSSRIAFAVRQGSEVGEKVLVSNLYFGASPESYNLRENIEKIKEIAWSSDGRELAVTA